MSWGILCLGMTSSPPELILRDRPAIRLRTRAVRRGYRATITRLIPLRPSSPLHGPAQPRSCWTDLFLTRLPVAVSGSIYRGSRSFRSMLRIDRLEAGDEGPSALPEGLFWNWSAVCFRVGRVGSRQTWCPLPHFLVNRRPMKRHFMTLALALCASLALFCTRSNREEVAPKLQEQRKYKLERVGPANIVQLYADGFEQLKPTEKILVYYLSLAAQAGRDIAIDQHHRKALEVRQLLEQIHRYSAGINPDVVRKLDDYLK